MNVSFLFYHVLIFLLRKAEEKTSLFSPSGSSEEEDLPRTIQVQKPLPSPIRYYSSFQFMDNTDLYSVKEETNVCGFKTGITTLLSKNSMTTGGDDLKQYNTLFLINGANYTNIFVSVPFIFYSIFLKLNFMTSNLYHNCKKIFLMRTFVLLACIIKVEYTGNGKIKTRHRTMDLFISNHLKEAVLFEKHSFKNHCCKLRICITLAFGKILLFFTSRISCKQTDERCQSDTFTDHSGIHHLLRQV